MARAEGWVNIATCSMYRWRGDLGVTFFPRYGQSFALCGSDPYGSRWAWGHEWARAGPSGRQVMDIGWMKHQSLPQQRMVAECGLQCVGRELVKV